MNEIKIFENSDFGKIQVIELNGEWRFHNKRHKKADSSLGRLFDIKIILKFESVLGALFFA